jgi:hypothetical protein
MPTNDSDDIDKSLEKNRADLASLQQRIQQMKERRDKLASEVAKPTDRQTPRDDKTPRD